MDRIEAETVLMLVDVVGAGDEPGEGIARMRGAVGWFLKMDINQITLAIIPSGAKIGNDPITWDDDGAAAYAQMPRTATVGEFFDRLRSTGSGTILEAMFESPDRL